MKPDSTFKMKWARDQGIIEGFRRGYKEGYDEGIQNTIQNYSSVILLCLKDKFDFTTEELQQVAIYINDMFDSICLDYLTLSDISNTLKEENNLEIRFNKSKELKCDSKVRSLSKIDSLDHDILEKIIKPHLKSDEDIEKQLKEAGGYFDE